MIVKQPRFPLFALAFACALAPVTAIAANLRVGAARVDITSPADPTNPPSGKYEHEHLYVRAIRVYSQ